MNTPDKFKKLFLADLYYFSIFDTFRGKTSLPNMTCRYKRNWIFSILLCFTISLNGQMLWPGDVNDNGVVNGVDVLYFGIAHGASGAIRPGATNNWTGQNIGDLWSLNFPDGVNYAYADGDGNGTVDEEDLDEVIKENLFLTHGALTPDEYSTGTLGEVPQLKLIPQNNSVQTGELIVFDLILGDSDLQAENFYGVAITLKYNDDFVFSNEWEFEEEPNAWYDPPGNNSLHLDEANENTDQIEVAITRINQQTITGHGKIGELSIVIEDIIFGLQDSLNLEIESIKMIDHELNTLQVVGDSAAIVVNSPNQSFDQSDPETVSVFPNPGNGQYSIRSNHPITRLELTDLSGRLAPFRSSVKSNGYFADISITSAREAGQLFVLKIYTEKGVVVKKILFI